MVPCGTAALCHIAMFGAASGVVVRVGVLASVDKDENGLCWIPLLVPCCWEKRVEGVEHCEEAWIGD